MNRISQGIGLGLLILLVAAGAAAVAWRQPAGEENSARVTVAATIFPLADMVKQIAGAEVEVVLVIPPGVTEHADTLTAQKLQELQNAKAIFQIGHGLDDHVVERIVGAVPSMQPVVVDRDITLHEFDPHYWLTVPNATEIAETVAKELIAIDPAGEAVYQLNLDGYRQLLGETERELQEKAAAIPRKEFMAMHDAWSYFADHYGLKLVATYEPAEGKKPSLQDLQHLQEIVRQYGLTTFYAEPQKSSGAVTEFMQREFGLKVRVLDPVGGLEGRETYIDLMRLNMEAIAEG